LLEGTRFCYPAESRAVESWRTIPNREDALLNPRYAASCSCRRCEQPNTSARGGFLQAFCSFFFTVTPPTGPIL